LGLIVCHFLSNAQCNVIATESANSGNTTLVKDKVQYSASISPNPTKDIATLFYKLPNETSGMFVLVDSYGKEIYRTLLESNSTEFTFSTLNINPSLYYYTVYSNKQLIGSGKLSIIR